jgi:hypothetical protein
MKYLAPLFASGLLLLSGCAVNPQKVQASVNGKSIGVSSCLEDRLENKWIGTTVFNNKSLRQPAPQYAIATTARDRAIEVLKQSQRLTEVKSLENCLSPKLAPKLPQGTEILLVIKEGRVPDEIAGTNQSQQGVGIFQRSVFGGNPFGASHSVFYSELYDLATLKLIGSTTCSVRGPLFVLDESMQLPESVLNDNRPLFQSLVRAAATQCLRKLGF